MAVFNFFHSVLFIASVIVLFDRLPKLPNLVSNAQQGATLLSGLTIIALKGILHSTFFVIMYEL
jgi:hypothetical protein